MKIIFTCCIVTLAAMYVLASVAIILLSGVMAMSYWHSWWMLPVQVFVGIFLLVFGLYKLLTWSGAAPEEKKP